jgi:hypothetical protein
MVTVLASNVIDRGVNHIGGVMVTVLASKAIDRGFDNNVECYISSPQGDILYSTYDRQKSLIIMS